jgi:hypothetical protein
MWVLAFFWWGILLDLADVVKDDDLTKGCHGSG